MLLVCLSSLWLLGYCVGCAKEGSFRDVVLHAAPLAADLRGQGDTPGPRGQALWRARVPEDQVPVSTIPMTAMPAVQYVPEVVPSAPPPVRT